MKYKTQGVCIFRLQLLGPPDLCVNLSLKPTKKTVFLAIFSNIIKSQAQVLVEISQSQNSSQTIKYTYYKFKSNLTVYFSKNA